MSEQERRIWRAYQQRFYVLDVNRGADTWVFKVSGRTANVYTITVSVNDGSAACDCPDHQGKGYLYCKHMCFLFVQVFHQSEAEIPGPFDVTTATVHSSVINERYTREYKQRSSSSGSSSRNSSSNCGSIPLTAAERTEECMVCFENYEEDADHVRCSRCRKVAHRACMQRWSEYNNGTSCIYCRNVPRGTSNEENGRNEYMTLSSGSGYGVV